MKTILLSILFSVVASSTLMAQDDLYFKPRSKAEKDKQKLERQERLRMQRDYYDDEPAYYCGSNRNVDEYNRRGKYATSRVAISSDSVASDVIDFIPGDGKYPQKMDTLMLAQINDSIATKSKKRHDNQYDEDDYRYSRRMAMYDDFYAPYWAPWHSWYFGVRPFYDPFWSFYDPWFDDPWFWHHHYAWGYPYYWNDPFYWGWGYPYRPIVVVGGYSRPVASHNHGNLSPRHGNFSGNSSARSMTRGVSSRQRTDTDTRSASSNFSGRRGTVASQRSTDNYRTTTRSYDNNTYSRSQSFSSSPFGGSRGGSFGGGSHGGSFGGGSRGGNFGGRR